MKKESIIISIGVLLLTIYVVYLGKTLQQVKQELNVLKSGAKQSLATSEEAKNTKLEAVSVPFDLEIKEGEGYAKNINN